MEKADSQPVLEFILQKRVRWILHLVFWGLVLLFYTLFFGHESGNYYHTFIFVSLLLVITIATSYFFIYFLIPKFFERRKYWTFLLFSLFTVIMSLYLETIAAFLMIFFYLFGEERPPDRTSIDVYFLVVAMYFIVFLVIAIKMMTSWYRRQQDMQEISRQKLEAELKMLRSQIQPHFLFNSLNSIYALSLKKSDEAPEMIIKLSGILDYLLYECDAELVLLEKEVTVIENYIELQSIRFGDKLKTKFQIEGEVGDIKIAPMLLLPLVENSFKHGVDAKRINAWVHIGLDVSAERMVFNISNSLSEKGTTEKEHGGIGLTNLKKRLNLLYPERYSFELTEDVDKFEINLEIELNEA